MDKSEKRARADRLMTEVLEQLEARKPAWNPLMRLLVLITEELWGPGEIKVE